MFAPLHNKPKAFKRVVRLVSLVDLTGSVMCIRSGMGAFIMASVALSMVCCGFGEAPTVWYSLWQVSCLGPGRKHELSCLLSRDWDKTGSGTYMPEPARIRTIAWNSAVCGSRLWDLKQCCVCVWGGVVLWDLLLILSWLLLQRTYRLRHSIASIMLTYVKLDYHSWVKKNW